MSDDVILGIRNVWGKEWQPFSLSCTDRRRPLYIIGKTGVGKSTLLENMILQDIEAGRGVGFIDPHGGSAERILDLIPRHRIEDVVYFDPSDMDYPVGFNLLAQVPPDERHVVASGLVSALKGIWSDSWGPRLEYILYAAIAALLECENVSLLGLQRMLSDEAYRRWVVKQVKDPMVRSFWVNEFERYDRRFLQEAIAPIQNKVGQLVMSPHIRNILGQVRNRVSARFMMDRKRIFIANLSKGKIGEDKANLLGSLWFTQFHLAAMSRANIPEDERTDFFLYVDEFQSFVSDAFASALSEVRKYRLCLTLSNQYLDQLKPGILAAIKGNVGSTIAFRVGHDDAKALENAFGESYASSHFTRLSNGEVCAKLLANGRDSEPFLGQTHPPATRSPGRSACIRRRSREKYSSPREVVERRIRHWLLKSRN